MDKQKNAQTDNIAERTRNVQQKETDLQKKKETEKEIDSKIQKKRQIVK
jgi:hypothetical protein